MSDRVHMKFEFTKLILLGYSEIAFLYHIFYVQLRIKFIFFL